MNTVLAIVEFIGIISFSFSATISAAKKGTDAIGALVFAVLTCFGGGFMRDLILGFAPPHLLYDPHYYVLAAACLLVSVLVFHLFFFERFKNLLLSHEHDFLIDFIDAIGLSVFCIFGVDVAATTVGDEKNVVLLIFCGCITGVGGGVLRDVCSAQLPFIFRKHIYILPAVFGASLYVLTYYHFHVLGHLTSLLLSIGFIVTVRVLAILFHWNLPTPNKKRIEGEQKSSLLQKK